MSLNYDLSAIENWKELTEGLEWQITETLIFSTLFVNLGKVTEENVIDWHVRKSLIDVLYGGSALYTRNDDGTRTPRPTREDIKRRIGLKVNATDTTDAEFFKDLARRYKELKNRRDL